ncbi:T9SS type A sorting domain-containing protein [Chryseobacterium scophthalmum]|uniref:Por secretion system C-terminal sorting domain-containing protein n=1 Tax=Chryseobacterium scophthalmum TaxID=59733 RepID=A0A1N6EPN4_9FLAO|nr:T9SS type A sorting domain-containing protein [Chryseobacterium scophthalmum]SIN85006.1 Por secretion system C-terminal sorting domain-containing protein [Chryseobacterium scophthalmum]
MTSKSLVLIAFGSLSIFFKAQTFPYERTWGTYIGATGTYLGDFTLNGNSFFIDPQQNIIANGHTSYQSSYNPSYYNQYVVGGGNMIVPSQQNYYSAKISPSGQMIMGGYNGISNDFEKIIGVDNSGNVYVLKNYPSQIPNLATSGTWLNQNVNTAGNQTYTLTKYDPSHNVMWTTYIPNNTISLRFDDNQNIYLLGSVKYDIPGLGTPGVFQENFVSYNIGGNSQENSYLVKLSPSGQKLWGTFSTPGIFDFKWFNDELYLVTAYSPQMPGNFTNPGTFQPTATANNLILKFNANTGQKIWGTFYGTPIHPTSFTGYGISAIEVNSTGIYVSGQNEDDAYPNYFATTGAYKNQLVNGDLFLSKFDFTGNRIWSTYFGSAGYDGLFGTSNLTVLGNRIVITGSQYGATSNISTPGAFLTTVPNTALGHTNMYFAEFDSNGNRIWASYYGGIGSNFLGEYINAKFMDNGSLVLWGATGSPTGIGTEGAAYQNMISPYSSAPFGFIAKFSLKDGLSTSELNKQNELQLYDNPNNGNFYLSGKALEKQITVVKIFDMSGKLLNTEHLNANKTHYLQMNGKLQPGNYLVEANTEKGEKLKVFKMTVK